ncbi:hypothetical protein [Lacunimicrobium album]
MIRLKFSDWSAWEEPSQLGCDGSSSLKATSVISPQLAKIAASTHAFPLIDFGGPAYYASPYERRDSVHDILLV